MILYHCKGARSFRVLWMLEELGLPYELQLLPFPPRVRQQNFLELNPLGTVPLLVDGESKMTESAAILHYLGTVYGPTDLVVRPDEPGYGTYLNFLFLGEATLTFPQTIVLRYSQLEPVERRLPQAVADYERWFGSRLRAAFAEAAGEFICAERFTAADISIGYALQLGQRLGLQSQFTPEITAYSNRLSARPAYRQALDSER